MGVQKLEIDGMGTNYGAENERKSAKSFNVLKYFKYIEVILTVS